LPMFRFPSFQNRVLDKKKTCLEYRMGTRMSIVRRNFFRFFDTAFAAAGGRTSPCAARSRISPGSASVRSDRPARREQGPDLPYRHLSLRERLNEREWLFRSARAATAVGCR